MLITRVGIHNTYAFRSILFGAKYQTTKSFLIMYSPKFLCFNSQINQLSQDYELESILLALHLQSSKGFVFCSAVSEPVYSFLLFRRSAFGSYFRVQRNDFGMNSVWTKQFWTAVQV